ncbi:MAG: hypothetical protein ACLUNZ_13945 [Evtepia sp.]
MKLLVIDGNSIVLETGPTTRMHPLNNQEGFPTHAIFGLQISCAASGRWTRATMCVAFDRKEPTFLPPGLSGPQGPTLRKGMPEELAVRRCRC